MRILKNKSKTSVIALILALTIVATLITAIPTTFGQVKINTNTFVWAGPTTVGLGQKVLIQGDINPRPLGYNQETGATGAIYKDLEFHFTKPDGTTETILMDTNPRSEAWFWYEPDQLGIYGVYTYWAGDDRHEDCRTERSRDYHFIVQEDSTPTLQIESCLLYTSPSPRDRS